MGAAPRDLLKVGGRAGSAPDFDAELRIAEHFGLPVEAVFSRQPFPPMSSQLSQRMA